MSLYKRSIRISLKIDQERLYNFFKSIKRERKIGMLLLSSGITVEIALLLLSLVITVEVASV